MSTDRSSHRPSFSAAGLSGSRAISMMRSESAPRNGQLQPGPRAGVGLRGGAAAFGGAELERDHRLAGGARGLARVFHQARRPQARPLWRARGHAAVRCPLRADCAAEPTGTPDANALPGQPALRPLAGGILGRHRSIARRPPARARPWSMRSPRERWSRASRLTPPYTRTRLAALPMCKSNSFHFLP